MPKHFRVGQVWLTRDGRRVRIDEIATDGRLWPVRSRKSLFQDTQGECFTLGGLWGVSDYELVEQLRVNYEKRYRVGRIPTRETFIFMHAKRKRRTPLCLWFSIARYCIMHLLREGV